MCQNSEKRKILSLYLVDVPEILYLNNYVFNLPIHMIPIIDAVTMEEVILSMYLSKLTMFVSMYYKPYKHLTEVGKISMRIFGGLTKIAGMHTSTYTLHE